MGSLCENHFLLENIYIARKRSFFEITWDHSKDDVFLDHFEKFVFCTFLPRYQNFVAKHVFIAISKYGKKDVLTLGPSSFNDCAFISVFLNLYTGQIGQSFWMAPPIIVNMPYQHFKKKEVFLK